jgi:hypothetical protein
MSENALQALYMPFEVWSYPPRRSVQQLTAEAKANINPNSPVIDYPVSFLELLELPRLLRDAGNIAIKAKKYSVYPKLSAKNIAKVNVIAQFGILPIIRDVLTLLTFAKAVNNREKYLSNLSRRETSVSRRLGQDEIQLTKVVQGIWPLVLDADLERNRINMSGKITREYWYSARVQLDTELTPREIRSAAFDAVHGLSGPSLDAAWQLLPWSWLIDYFSTIGDILAANRGGIPWSYKALNLMCHSTFDISSQIPMPYPSTLTVQGDESHTVSHVKWRRQGSLVLFPVLKIPYLSLAQYSILSSLITIKVRF